MPASAPATVGSASRRTIQVKVPAGVEDGMRIRLTGQGEVGPGGGPAGDLYVEVHERPHDVFTRDGEDLHCRVTLPMTAAALGTTLSLKTLDGEEDLDIRPGTQSGSVLTLRAHGAPRLRATGRGNLLVHVEVDDADAAGRRAGEAAAGARRAARGGPARVAPGGAGRPLLPGPRRVQRALSLRRTTASRSSAAHRCSSWTSCPSPATCWSTAPRAGTRSTSCGSRRASGSGSATVRGRWPTARSLAPAPDGLRVAVRARLEVPPQTPEFVLVQALPKGDRGPLAVELATELGVDRIVPWAAARCVTRWRDDRDRQGRREVAVGGARGQPSSRVGRACPR